MQYRDLSRLVNDLQDDKHKGIGSGISMIFEADLLERCVQMRSWASWTEQKIKALLHHPSISR